MSDGAGVMQMQRKDGSLGVSEESEKMSSLV